MASCLGVFLLSFRCHAFFRFSVLVVCAPSEEARQPELDAKVDSANARFADLQVELQYEVDRVEKKVGQGGPKGADGAAAPCVALRANLAACFREADDVRKCDGYIDALERCVKVEVVKQ